LPITPDALPTMGWGESLREIGGPVLLGMGIFGFGGAVLSYLLVKLSWRIRVAFKRHRSNVRASRC
ncbi:MAG: hypothetical protein RJB17_506, partial [Pseudomonadota bacterium]